jgi:hypothetical protein
MKNLILEGRLGVWAVGYDCSDRGTSGRLAVEWFGRLLGDPFYYSPPLNTYSGPKDNTTSSTGHLKGV